jgi:hypothetical protein
MFHGASPNALALSNSAIFVEILKAMDDAKRLALLDRAAEALKEGPTCKVFPPLRRCSCCGGNGLKWRSPMWALASVGALPPSRFA